MAGDRDIRIDPRFDPAFQRGSAGEVVIGAAEPATRQALFLPPPVIVAPPGVPSVVPKGTVPQPDSSVPTAGPDDALAELAAAFDDEEDAVVEGRNPFVIALWILGPALIGVGVGLYWASISLSWGSSGAFGSANDTMRQAIVSTLYAVGPSMVTIGMATIAGLLFRRTRAETSENG